MNEELQNKLRPKLMTIKIISAALCSGVIFFMGIVVFMLVTGDPPDPEEAGDGAFDIFTLVAGFFSIQAIFVWFAMPYFLSRRQCNAFVTKLLEKNEGSEISVDDVAEEFTNYLATESIVRGAIAEGPALFLCIVAMITESFLPLPFALFLVCLIAIASLPAFKIEDWLDTQLKRGKEFASLKGNF